MLKYLDDLKGLSTLEVRYYSTVSGDPKQLTTFLVQQKDTLEVMQLHNLEKCIPSYGFLTSLRKLTMHTISPSRFRDLHFFSLNRLEEISFINVEVHENFITQIIRSVRFCESLKYVHYGFTDQEWTMDIVKTEQMKDFFFFNVRSEWFRIGCRYLFGFYELPPDCSKDERRQVFTTWLKIHQCDTELFLTQELWKEEISHTKVPFQPH